MSTTKDIPSYLSNLANTGPALSPAANRLHGANQHDFTSHMPSQVSWTIDSMPDILYQWKPTAANINTDEVDLKPYLVFGKVLRDFDVLPDRISSNVEPWLLQAWFRLDSRIRWEDITDRIELSARPKWNTINMDCVRQREDFFMRPWSTSKGVSTRTRDAVFEKVLRKAGIDPARNTTRGLTPGLIGPNAGPNGARIPVPERWTKARKQRKAEVDAVVVVKGTRARPSLSISSLQPDAKTRKITEREEAAQSQGDNKTEALARLKFKFGSTRMLRELRPRINQAVLADDVEIANEKQPRKRKARTVEIEEANEDRTPRRRDMETAKSQQLPEKTPRKRKAVRGGETEQREQERPRNLPKLRSQAVKELEVKNAGEDYDHSFHPERWSAKGREYYNLHMKNMKSVPSASSTLQKHLVAAGNCALTLANGNEPTNSFDVGAMKAYIGYLQAPVVEPKDLQIGGVRSERPTKIASNTSRHAPVFQSPILGTLDFRAYADTETEHSTDLSLPSAVMTPRDLGEDMISSNHSTQCDLFADYMVDGFEDFFQRTF